MRDFYEKIIKILRVLKWFCFFAICAYVLIFSIELLNTQWFQFWDSKFSRVPDFFNMILPFKVTLLNTTVPTGYIFASIYFYIVWLLADFYIESSKEAIFEISVKQEEEKLKQMTKIHLEKEKLPQENVPDKFYGLFDLELLEDENALSKTDVNDLKEKYINAIMEKLKEKYQNNEVQFSLCGSIFFIFHDISKWDKLINDFLTLYNSFKEIAQKTFQLNLKLSFYGHKNVTTKNAREILIELNNLNLVNKIIVNKEIVNFYEFLKIARFKFTPMGEVKIFLNNEDKDIEIYRLMNNI